jgi:hypothetical protein
MRRREFITLVGAAAWPGAAHAQPVKLQTIGFVSSGSPSTQGQLVARFAQRLREFGWIDGRTVAIEYRWTEGGNERATEAAAEFVRRNVDIIVTVGTPATAAAKHATSFIPIVCLVVGDPVGSGFVASLSRPGGNISGVSNQAADIATKRLELLRDLIPNLQRLTSWAMSTIPSCCRRCAKSRRQPVRLAWRLLRPKSGGHRDRVPGTQRRRASAVCLCRRPDDQQSSSRQYLRARRQTADNAR